MNKIITSSVDTSEISTEETSIIDLIPCDYDSSEENDYLNISKDSIDSSELVDDSDGEFEVIKKIYNINKILDKADEKNDVKNDEFIEV